MYLRVNDEWNLDREALERRKGKGAKIEIRDLDAEGVLDVQELLGHYCDELRATGQEEEARADRWRSPPSRSPHFLMSIPEQQQTDPSISTE